MASGIRVLHVDDDQAFLDLAATFLEREPEIAVESESEVDAATQRLTGTGIDCVVSDYEMPEADGLELLSMVRARKPELPFILFTGKGSEEIAKEAISAGVTDYIQKSTTTEQYQMLANQIKNAVSEHRATERSRRTRRRYHQLVENAPTPIVTYRTDEIVNANDAAAEFFGFEDSAALLGTSLTDRVHSADRSRISAALNRVIETGETVNGLESRFLDREGNTRYAVAASTYLNIEGEPLGQAVLADTTELEGSRRELERYRATLDAMDDGIYTLDRAGRFTFVNDALTQLTGHPHEELRGTERSMVASDASNPQYEAALEALASGELAERTLEVEIVTADGEWISCRDRLISHVVDGEYRGVTGVLRPYAMDD